MISTPFGNPCCRLAILAFTASMVSSAFFPARMMMMPPTASPLPSSSEMPRRISGPICTRATSPSSTGVPPAPRPTGTLRKSSRFLRYPVARTAYSASPISRTDPPVSLFESRKADLTLSMVIPSARIRSGSSTTWYCLTSPPRLATSATFGTLFSSYFRNQSCSARSCEMS